MSKLDTLRKIIREEVTAAIKQQLPLIINEIRKTPNSGISNVIKEMKKQDFPMTLNTADTYKKNPNTKFTNSPHLNNLLNETATTMQSEDTLSFTSDDVSPLSFFQPNEAAVVSDVSDMLSTARKSSNLDAVQINAVPDYSALMKNLKDKGAI
jgi:hypothetical protein